MNRLLAFAAMALMGCAKDEPDMATVTFKAMCDDCAVETTAGGGHVVFSQEWSGVYDVGTEVFIRATPLHPSDTTTMITIDVDGAQQAMEFNGIVDSTLRSVEIRMTVPDLDRFGVPKP